MRARLHEIIFEAETLAGKLFDLGLLISISVSVLVVLLESVEAFHAEYGAFFSAAEWTVTVLFTIEYLLRLYAVKEPAKYARSFFGVVDLLSILPTYASLVLPGVQSLVVIRALRLLRVFRVLKLGRFVGEGQVLWTALRQSRHKIVVFLGSITTLVLIIGTLMYLIEGAENGFTSIPRAIYWAIVTMTTVGYGDIAPHTPLGQAVSSLVMILGYAIIAVPTGIVSVEMAAAARLYHNTISCPSCSKEGHDKDSDFCRFCGAKLSEH